MILEVFKSVKNKVTYETNFTSNDWVAFNHFSDIFAKDLEAFARWPNTFIHYTFFFFNSSLCSSRLIIYWHAWFTISRLFQACKKKHSLYRRRQTCSASQYCTGELCSWSLYKSIHQHLVINTTVSNFIAAMSNTFTTTMSVNENNKCNGPFSFIYFSPSTYKIKVKNWTRSRRIWKRRALGRGRKETLRKRRRTENNNNTQAGLQCLT